MGNSIFKINKIFIILLVILGVATMVYGVYSEGMHYVKGNLIIHAVMLVVIAWLGWNIDKD